MLSTYSGPSRKRKVGYYNYKSQGTKRKYGSSSMGYRKKFKVIPGFTRASGYYGRFRPRFISIEKKFFDVNVTTPVAITQAPKIMYSSLNLVTSGAGEQQMIGRKINVKSITLKQIVTKDDNTGVIGSLVSNSSYRIALVLDRQANGAAANATAVYETTHILSPLKLENSKRFYVIKEWYGTINQVGIYNGTNYDVPRNDAMEFWFKRCNIQLNFASEATPGTRVITEVQSNNLFLIASCTESDTQMYHRFHCRIRFTDA